MTRARREEAAQVEELERQRVTADDTAWALRRFQRASADYERALAAHLGLGTLDYAAIGHLLDAPAGLTAGEIAARLGISSGSTTELVDRLERHGHAARTRSEVDRRQVSVTLTPSGVQAVITSVRPVVERISAAARRLTPAQRQAVAQFLRDCADLLDTETARMPPNRTHHQRPHPHASRHAPDAARAP